VNKPKSRFSGHSTEIAVNRPDQIKVEINIALIIRSLSHLDALRKRMSVSRVYASEASAFALDASKAFGGPRIVPGSVPLLL
jgi:hypothetical protein